MMNHRVWSKPDAQPMRNVHPQFMSCDTTAPPFLLVFLQLLVFLEGVIKGIARHFQSTGRWGLAELCIGCLGAFMSITLTEIHHSDLS